MERRRLLVLVAGFAFVLALGISLVVVLRNREPEYRGKRLSKWVAELDYPSPRPPVILRLALTGPSPVAQQALGAVRQMGTNTLPYLLEWSAYQASSRESRILEAVNQLFKRLGLDFSAEGRTRRASKALTALAALGPQAKGAIPALALRLYRPLDQGGADGAAWVFAHLGREGAEVLGSALRDTRNPNRRVILRNLCTGDASVSAPVTVIIECLNDPDQFLASEAAMTLGVLKLEPDRCVIALSESLSDKRDGVRRAAAAGLVLFKEAARPAIPALTRLLNNTNADVREFAAKTMNAIDPQGAETVFRSPDQSLRRNLQPVLPKR